MKRKFIICILIVILAAVLIYIFMHINSSEDAKHYSYNSAEKAINEYLLSEYKSDDTDNMILKKYKYGKTIYYVIKSEEIYEEENFAKNINYVSVVAVKQKQDKYNCIKISSDFALDSPDSVNDIDYTPYVQFVIPTDNEALYFVVGKVFDVKYRVYFNDKKINLDKDKIFCIVSENREPLIKYVHN